MASDRSAFGELPQQEPQDFSLVLGGPLYQLLRKGRMAGSALEMARRRTIVIALFAWLPLLALSALQGDLLGDRVAVPFLRDVEVHVRFLLALPLLIVAELVVHKRLRFVVKQFQERRLIPASAMPRFEAAVHSALRLRNSVFAEVLLLAIVYIVGVALVWRSYMVLGTATWYATPTADGTKFTLGGIWYGYVSLPLFQFLLLRWYYRIFIWARFLWQVSRLDLALVPTHPDGVGGIGFLANTAFAFIPLAAAHGAILAGVIANRIFYAGAGLLDFKVELALVLLLLLCLVFGPLLLFADRLAESKRRGLREYGTLAERYVREFDGKWLRGGAPPGEAFVGSADIQSLADLGNSYEVVRHMRMAPVTRDAIFQVTVATLLPVVPLGLTLMSMEDLLKKLAGVLF